MKTPTSRRSAAKGSTTLHAVRRTRLPQLLAIATLSAIGATAHAQEGTFSATAFDTCPSQAFLTQGQVPATFGVNLVTGHYTVHATTHGVSQPLNAVGFNENDRFLYGWSYQHGQPARIHNDWSVESLGDVNITDKDFYVGDVATSDNTYYVYRNGANYGLYAIGLDASRSDYLTMTRVIDGASLFLRVADMAVNPVDDMIYAVDTAGMLHRIDRSTGASVALGDTGESGTFGAAYFDPDGNLYVGRNNDGSVFRIAVTNGSYDAVLFASGPASNTNDGSRCASAPLSDVANTDIDFGDAPDTYATSLEQNGARHGLLANPDLHFGSSVDGESDAYVYPLTDDDNGEIDDEDGIQMVTDVIERENAIAMITASEPGYLNVWIDIHQDGRFDAIDKVASAVQLQAGQQAVYLPIPNGVFPGDTWARFRLSSTAVLEPHGGAADGEVEDMQVRLSQNEVAITDYPSSTGWTTIAFEDNWPLLGDYDMNDLVVYMRTSTHRRTEGLLRVDIAGEVAAAGAGYHNGFGIRLPGVQASDVDPDQTQFKINGQDVSNRALLESGRNEAILIIAEDVFDYVGSGNHCEYYRTEPGCGSSIQMDFEVSVSFNSPVDVSIGGAFDPFLFAAEGAWHGAHFTSPPGRSYEIHLKNQAPTEAFNQALFSGAGQDASIPGQGHYFQSTTGMPWAIEIGNRWQYPLEFTDISVAYPQFPSFSTSDGNSFMDWYESGNAVNERLFSE